MAHFMDIVESGLDEDHDRLVLDVELDHGYSKARITQTVIDCMSILRQLTGRYPIIYSELHG